MEVCSLALLTFWRGKENLALQSIILLVFFYWSHAVESLSFLFMLLWTNILIWLMLNVIDKKCDFHIHDVTSWINFKSSCLMCSGGQCEGREASSFLWCKWWCWSCGNPDPTDDRVGHDRLSAQRSTITGPSRRSAVAALIDASFIHQPGETFRMSFDSNRY